MSIYRPNKNKYKRPKQKNMDMEYPPRMSDEEFEAFLRSLYIKYGGEVPKRLEEKDPIKKAYGESGLMEL